MSLITHLSVTYSSALSQYYYPTQSLTMSAFCTAGDALAQYKEIRVSSDSKKFDWSRNRQFMLKGLGCGIIWTIWYFLCDIWSKHLTLWGLRAIRVSSRKYEALFQTVASLLLEQFVASPVIFACWDLPILCLLQGKSPRAIPNMVKEKLVPLLVANAKLWTPANILIYNMPLEYRLLTQSIFVMLWEAIVSSIASKRSGVEEVSEEKKDERSRKSKES